MHYLVNRAHQTIGNQRLRIAASLACTALMWAGCKRAPAQAAPAGPSQATAAPLPVPPLPTVTPAAAGTVPPGQVNPAETKEAQQQIAERLVDNAQDTLQQFVPNRAMWQRATAQVHAASRLNPDEPRYPRLLAEARTEVGDTQGAIDALNTYRTILYNAQTSDPTAQCRLIELYLSQLQTVKEQVDYLKEMVSAPALPPEVQSHAAALAVPLLLERSEREADDMVKKAVALNPLNARAQRLQYELIARREGPVDQLQSLLDRLRADPAQIPVLAEVARQLAEAGLASESLVWFDRALSLEGQTRGTSNIELIVQYCAALYVAGFPQSVEDLTSRVLSSQPDNIDAIFMRLALKKDQAQGVAYEQELAAARRQLTNRATTIARQVLAAPAGGAGTGAATRPAAPPLAPNADPVAAAVARVKQGDVPLELRSALIGAATDAAWFEVYFARRPGDASNWIQILAQLLPPGDLTLQRMQGWLDLVSGDPRQAKAKLSAIQDRDPLAALGMVNILSAEAPAGARPGSTTAPSGGAGTLPARGGAAAVPATRPSVAATTSPAAHASGPAAQADEIGRRLLEQNPTGLLGMMLSAALKERKLQVRPNPIAIQERAVLTKFPTGWMDILDRPEKFYLLVGTALGNPVKLGQPMFARVTLQNVSGFDISVGPDGTIKPDLWFDAKLILATERSFPMAGYDKISGPLVLKARTANSQVVRVNQGALGETLREKPAASISLYVTAMTNPISVGSEIARGPGGLKRELPRFIRTGMPINTAPGKKKLYDALNGLPSEKMQAIEVLVAYIRESREEGAQGWLLGLAPELQEQLEKARGDAVPEVGEWATYQVALLADAAAREKALMSLANSKKWEARLLALIGAAGMDAEGQTRVASKLVDDPDPDVKAVAVATLDLARHPAPKRPPPAAAGQGGAAGASSRPSQRGGPATQPGETPAGPKLP